MRNKILLLTMLLITAFSFITTGQTPHTIAIDGVNDFNILNEEIAGTSGSKWYSTWDANKIYFGIDATDVNSNSGQKWVLLYIDTDPQLNPTSGNGTSTGINYNTQQPGLPFNADFHFRWKADGTYSNIQKWNGSAWIDAVASFGSGNDCEIFKNGSYLLIFLRKNKYIKSSS